MELKQTRKPRPKCTECSNYLSVNYRLNKEGQNFFKFEEEETVFISFFCDKCSAEYEWRKK